MSGGWGWIGCVGLGVLGWSLCVQAQNNPATAAAPSCSGRFPPVTCVAGGRTLNGDATGPTTIMAPGAAAAGSEPHAPAQPSAKPETTAETQTGAAPEDAEPLPLNKDELFGIGKPGDATAKKPPAVSFRGFLENETAYTYASPAHWSRAVTYAQLGASGQLSDNLKWKVTVRGNVDPIYIWSNFYNDAVKKDEQSGILFEETYIDASVSDWDFRIGRQNIIWGEVVGLFVADVVSAQNQLEFILPAFDIIRIPQWAARGEYFFGDSHLELIWIPYPTYNNIGKPGADFYPVQPGSTPSGFTQSFLGEVIPERNVSNTNYGVRLSTLKSGWDMSGFYYSSVDAAPTFDRTLLSTPTPTLQYQPVHNRIWQVGGTVGKAFGSVVFHAEGVYTSGRQYEVTTLTQPNGVVPQNTLEYVLSADFTLPKDLFLNVQFIQNVFFNHDPNLLYNAYDTYASVLLRGKLGPKLEPEILWIQSLNQWQNLIRPRLVWHPATNWQAAFGVDIFNGPSTGYFGRFNDRDRVYAEVRYNF
jgi:hypothetical protein